VRKLTLFPEGSSSEVERGPGKEKVLKEGWKKRHSGGDHSEREEPP